MLDLRGRCALVTGGTQGVGAAIASSLARAGANLVLHGLHDDELAKRTVEHCRAFGVRVSPLFVDLSKYRFGIFCKDTKTKNNRQFRLINSFVKMKKVGLNKNVESELQTFQHFTNF